MATKKKEPTVSLKAFNAELAYSDQVQQNYERLVIASNQISDMNDLLAKQLRGQSRKIANQRTQLRMYQEKMELMRTFRGITRTIGQKLGVSR